MPLKLYIACNCLLYSTSVGPLFLTADQLKRLKKYMIEKAFEIISYINKHNYFKYVY